MAANSQCTAKTHQRLGMIGKMRPKNNRFDNATAYKYAQLGKDGVDISASERDFQTSVKV